MSSRTNSNTLSHKYDPSPNRTPAVPLDKYLKENYFRITHSNSNSYESPDIDAVRKKHPYWYKTVGKKWLAKGKKTRRKRNTLRTKKIKRKIKVNLKTKMKRKRKVRRKTKVRRKIKVNRKIK